MKRRNEREFGVRIRVAVPKEGFGKQLDEMFHWLDTNVGRMNYGHSADAVPGQDAKAFYFTLTEHAHAFQSAFDLTLVDMRETSGTNAG